MRPGRSYSPTADQAALTARMDLAKAFRACRSFRKLVDAFGQLLGLDREAGTWPPGVWSRP